MLLFETSFCFRPTLPLAEANIRRGRDQPSPVRMSWSTCCAHTAVHVVVCSQLCSKPCSTHTSAMMQILCSKNNMLLVCKQVQGPLVLTRACWQGCMYDVLTVELTATQWWESADGCLSQCELSSPSCQCLGADGCKSWSHRCCYGCGSSSSHL